LVYLHHSDCGFVTVADAAQSGDFRFGMTGRPPQNEQDTRDIAITLAEVLSRSDGKSWEADPKSPEREDGTDWFLRSAGDELPIQVTRVAPQKRWDTLGANREVDGNASASDAAAEMWAAIERKLPQQDERTVLALNIRHPGFHAFPAALQEFVVVYGTRLRGEVRYAQVWAIGYGPELSHCLYRRG
jgi:hypothetical protein